MQLDLKILDGQIVDGSGRPRYVGDVGIADGHVVALGRVDGTARKTIAANRSIVAPGFVDIHTHYDAQLVWDRQLSISPWHGVTTVVIGNCGFGIAPSRPAHYEYIARTMEKVEGMSFAALSAGLGAVWPFQSFPQYLDMVEARGCAINVAVMQGHTPLRVATMGLDAFERAATPAEVAQMTRLLEVSMEAGAIGFATSRGNSHVGYKGMPVPSRHAAREELQALVETAAAHSGILQAAAGPGLFLREFEELAGRTGVTICWSSLLAGLAIGARDHRKILAESAKLVAAGHRIYPQVASRSLQAEYQFGGSCFWESLPVFAPAARADRDQRAAIFRDTGFRNEFREAIDAAPEALRKAFALTIVSENISDRSMEESLLIQAAASAGQHPVDFALDLALATNLEARFRMPIANYDETELEFLLGSPEVTVIGLSDAGAHVSQLCDACQPTYFLGHWVRDKRLVPLETGVQMLTSRPAQIFGLRDRGLLAVGRPADIVIFDPDTIGAGPLRRVFDQPNHSDRLVSDASGIISVIVNGAEIRRANGDVPNTTQPGRLLRGGAAH